MTTQTYVANSLGIKLHTLGGGIPDQFVDLQAEPRGNFVGEDPLREFLRIEEAVRSVSRAGGRLFDRGGEKNRVNAPGPPVIQHEVVGELVVRAARYVGLELI